MDKAKKIIITVLVIVGTGLAIQSLAQDIKLNPIKPGQAASGEISDEQQAILAVRLAKESVVNIVGVSKPSTVDTASGTSQQILVSPALVSGTGFVLESDGVIVTNNHVVERPDFNYTVILPDGTEYPATTTASDTVDDIALLKISAQNLVPAKLGDSDALETGQSVFAIGNSLGKYENTVTRGVISGLSRSVDSPDSELMPSTHSWIQTDAAINPGNSGGPLIDLDGEVVGMNTLIDTEGSSLGFAIPVNLIKSAWQQIKTFGKVSRPYLGILYVTIDPEARLEKNLPADLQGAYVVSVQAGSAADAAGLKANDIIVAINGQNLDQENELAAIIQKYQAGNQATFKILRGTDTLELQVILGELK